MKRTARIALAALLIAAAACHRNSKEAQLKALDEAYKSGVFSKEEYDAKKQALVGTPAPAPAPPAAAVAPAPADATPSAPPPDQNPPAGALPDPSAALPPPDAAPAQALPPPAQPARAQAYPPPAPAQPSPAYTPPAAPQAAPAPGDVPAAPQPAAQTGEPEPAPLKGCPDAGARAGGPRGAQQRFFPVSEDAVRAAALQAFANLDFTVHNSTAHEMEASKKGRAGTGRVILHFESMSSNGQNGTQVVGETKRGIMGRVTQKPWTGAVLAQIECNLRGGR
jgi:hypothetical protein